MMHIVIHPVVRPRLSLAILAAMSTPLAAQRESAPAPAHQVAVAGTVFDSVMQRPLSGATVQLVSVTTGGRAYSVTSDSDGTFRFTSVEPGRYVAAFYSDALITIGIDAVQRGLDVRAQAPASLSLAVPSPERVRRVLCGADDRSDSSGVLVGFVRDADDSLPLGESRVVLFWNEIVIDASGVHRETRRIPVKAAKSGWYVVCDVPTDIAVSGRAELGSRTSGAAELSIPPRGVLEFDFAVPADSAAVVVDDNAGAAGAEPVRRGTARVTGMIRDEAGSPIAGATVLVRGGGSQGITGADGRFVLDSLPAGTQTVEARVLGYAPAHGTVTLRSGRTTQAIVVMTERVNALDQVQVYGKKRRQLFDVTGFQQRRQHGMGQFLTRKDVERRRPTVFSDIVRGVPGVRVEAIGGLGHRVLLARSTEACQPALFLDGVQLTDVYNADEIVDATGVTAVEVYEVAQAPAEYRKGSCGTILVWTSRRP